MPNIETYQRVMDSHNLYDNHSSFGQYIIDIIITRETILDMWALNLQSNEDNVISSDEIIY